MGGRYNPGDGRVRGDEGEPDVETKVHLHFFSWMVCLHYFLKKFNPEIQPDTSPLRYGSGLVLLCHTRSGNPHWLHFVQYCPQLELRPQLQVCVINTTAQSVPDRRISRRACICFFFWDLCAGVKSECFILKSNQMVCCCFGVWLPVRSVLNSAELLRCAHPPETEVLCICSGPGAAPLAWWRRNTADCVWWNLGVRVPWVS